MCDPTAGSGPGIAPLAWSWERGRTWEEHHLRWTDQSDCCSGEKRTPWDSGGGEERESGVKEGWREEEVETEDNNPSVKAKNTEPYTSTRCYPSPPQNLKGYTFNYPPITLQHQLTVHWVPYPMILFQAFLFSHLCNLQINQQFTIKNL